MTCTTPRLGIIGTTAMAFLILTATPAMAMGKKKPAAPPAPPVVVPQGPCAEPNPDASTLFSMISNPATSAQDVQSFIQTHTVAWDAENDQCQTTIFAAISVQRADLYEALYSHYQPDLNAAVNSAIGTQSIYSYALQFGSVPLLMTLKQEAAAKDEPLALSPLGDPILTDLMCAVSSSKVSPAMVEYLIRGGTDVNAVDGIFTALIKAVQYSTPAVVQTLIQAGANVNLVGSTGDSALMVAVQFSTVDVVHALIQAKAAVNAVDSIGYTPLLYAAQSSTAGVVTALLQAGAASGATIAIKAVIAGAGATLNPPSGSDAWSSCQEVQENNEDPVVCTESNGGVTALMLAADRTADPGVIDALIQAGASVNATDSMGSTALMYAANENIGLAAVTVVDALIQAGASVNVRDSYGLTALTYAQNRAASGGTTGNSAVVSALTQAGAVQ